MGWLPRISHLLRTLFRSEKVDRELDEELRFHLDSQMEANRASGMSPDEARYAALRTFGGLDLAKEQCRDTRALLFVDNLLQDARIAMRGMRKRLGFASVVILTMALGIGANTAIFSILDKVLLRSLPVSKPEELVYLYHPGPAWGNVSTDEPDMPAFSYSMFRDLQAQQTAFTGLAGARSQDVNLSYEGQASGAIARLVSGNYFDVLGIKPAQGRLLTEQDDTLPGANPIVVLGHAYWASRLGSAANVLGQTITVNGHPMTVVGVAPKGFTGESLGSVPDIFVPITMKQMITPDWDGFRSRRVSWIGVFGRLKQGVSVERAAAEINIAYKAQLELDIAAMAGLRSPQEIEEIRAKKIIFKTGPQGRGGLRQEDKRPLFLIAGMTMLVLLLCCANVASLQLARSIVRARELALRRAVGASRSRLVRQLLTEALLIALSGCGLGLMIAYVMIHSVLSVIPQFMMTHGGFPTPELDARVLGFSIVLAVSTAILFGLFPALRASKSDLVTSLKDDGSQSAAGRGFFLRKGLVSFQLAVSLVLLIAASLLGQTLMTLVRTDVGLRTDHLLTFSVNPKLNQYTDARTLSFSQQLITRLRSLPGVELVSAAQVKAIGGEIQRGHVAVEGRVPDSTSRESNLSNYSSIAPDFFRTLDIPLIAGREFTEGDTQSAPKVAVVNEAFVQQFFPDRDPIGRRIGQDERSAPDLEIVGVVKKVKYSSVREEIPPVFYTPYWQLPRQGQLHFYLRTTTEPQQLMPTVRREVAALDSNLPIQAMKTMEMQIAEGLYWERLLSLLTGLFAFLATLIAAVGLYGVLSFNVARRTREIGIRSALGAARTKILTMVVGQGLKLALAGVGIGMATSLSVTRVMVSQLYGVGPTDSITLIAVALLVLCIAGLASYIPARRAARVDPMIALRSE